ncbi:MAG: hypothetical protein RL375_3584 [Pseudomonadota bacterium]|jgi:hypothetical protein
MNPHQESILIALEADIDVSRAELDRRAAAVAGLRASLTEAPPVNPQIFGPIEFSDINSDGYTVTWQPTTVGHGPFVYRLNIVGTGEWMSGTAPRFVVAGRFGRISDMVVATVQDAEGRVSDQLRDRVALPPVVNPPPPPPPVGTVEAFAGNHYQRLFRAPAPAEFLGKPLSVGPRDTLRLGVVPPPPAWDVFVDRDTRLIAPSAQGVESERMHEVLPIYGTRNFATYNTPAVVDGEFRQLYGALGDDPVDIVRRLDAGEYPLRSGPRGVGTWTAYTTWHGHVDWAKDADGNSIVGQRTTNQRVPLWVGITIDGQMAMAMADGSIQYVYKMPREKGSYFYDFTYYEPKRATQFVVDTGLGIIWSLTHAPDVKAFAPEVFATGYLLPTSIRAIGHMLYVVESGTGHVWEIDARTKERRLVRTVPQAWWVDYDSKGRLVVLDTRMWVHIIDPTTGDEGPPWTAVNPPLLGGARKWVQCDVDRGGTCGTVDAVLTCSTHGSGNVDVYRNTIAGKRLPLVASFGQAVVGPTHLCGEVGHYPWAVAHHPTQGMMLVHGYAEVNPTIVAVKQGRKWADYSAFRANVARQAWQDGGDEELRGLVPSFTCQVGVHGHSLGLLTFDALMQMEPQAAADFLRAGGIGSVPRDIPTDTMRALLGWAAYNSLRHVQEATRGTAAEWMNEWLQVV